MLKVKNIVKYYGNNKAVDNLSFEVKMEKYLAYLEKMEQERQRPLELSWD